MYVYSGLGLLVDGRVWKEHHGRENIKQFWDEIFFIHFHTRHYPGNDIDMIFDHMELNVAVKLIEIEYN